jgi:DNA-binding transcriptional MerR regulator
MSNRDSTASEVPERPFFRIGEVSRLTATKAFVLRYWETEFPMLQPVKSPSGHRLYRRQDIETVLEIRRLLYQEGFTIAGARKHLSEQGSGGNGHAKSATSGRAVAAPARAEVPSRAQRRLLLDLHEELLAILTLLERK